MFDRSRCTYYLTALHDNIAELERRLEDAGYAVGARVMERLCNREKVLRCVFSETKLILVHVLLPERLKRQSVRGKAIQYRLIVSGERERDTVTWNFIFHEDEYMISEKELLVNRCISIPKDMGTFNCGAFVAGIVKVSVLLGRFINRVQKWGKL
ncbi:hypothetical protein IGI04_040834 [Brassica rapa subsp. trilocularis]|uniref:Uncharacterized protein n=1 Tax=Brassica rapa subsp. trilocularis TaxID=1813537 RepID=A0ABQ7KP20_BRACM|nr:hypothetical protein IGI04_040834 [Brassica rapa subsp. trilocularis]